MIRSFFLVLSLGLVLQASAAQKPAPAAALPATTVSASAQQKPAPAQPSAYSYNPEGRRDPFVSLLGRGNEPAHGQLRPAGLPGVMIGEVTIKGILRDRGGFIAMIQAQDNKTYIVRVGERLLDGTVKSITQDSVIFSQDVNDPLSLVKQREIRKTIRAVEGRG